MAETTADVQRDIELTRERMSSTIEELERKLNVAQIVRDHPWPAIALAVGAGVLLAGSKADVKAAAATVAATQGASSKLGTALDDVVGSLVTAAQGALQGHVDQLVDEIKNMMAAPQRSGVSKQAGYAVGADDLVPASETGPASVRDISRAD